MPGLANDVAQHVRPGGDCGVNADLKVACLVAGVAAGADSIDDMDLLRHGAMQKRVYGHKKQGTRFGYANSVSCVVDRARRASRPAGPRQEVKRPADASGPLDRGRADPGRHE